MRKFFFALVVAAAILPWQSVNAAPGQVTQADPQLLQTFWTSLAVRDGVRERDTVRIEHNGQTVAEGLVVSVTADHSVVMLRGTNPATPQAGDSVVVVKQAAVLPTTKTDAPKVGYKVVGGHSFLQFNSTGISADSFNVSGTQPAAGEVNFSSGSWGDTGLNFNNSLGIGSTSFSGTSFSSGSFANSSFSIGNLGIGGASFGGGFSW